MTKDVLMGNNPWTKYCQAMDKDEKERIGAPTNPDVIVWRYLSFTKFISMLETNSLFFCRSNLLEDKFEGSLSKVNIGESGEFTTEGGVWTFAEVRSFYERQRQNTFVNCWCINDYESEAMWRLFGKTEAVAIQSTYRRVRECLSSTIYIGTVRYVDYESEPIPYGWVFEPYLRKRKSFEHEHELRALYQRHHLDKQLAGEYEHVNLIELISSVCVAPGSQDWFYELVIKMLKKYGLDIPCMRTKLDEKPFI